MGARTILVTGATGFIGGAAAATLAGDSRVERLLLLVRAPDEATAWARARRSLARFEPAPDMLAWDHADVIAGDLCDAEVLADPRLSQVTHVLHAAASTSFRSVREVWRTNVEGTLALGERMRSASRLERFVHVSTAYCCGARAPAVVHEDDPPGPEAPHVVEYTRTKAEGERRLAALAPGLPLVVARPSVVVGHTRLGCGPSASLLWYYRALARIGRAPFPPERPRDIVPVDYVAEGLLLLLFAPRLRHRIYHVSAGEAGRVPWGEIAATLARLEGTSGVSPPRCVDADALADPALLREALGPGDAERLAGAMALCARFATVRVEHFDNRRLLAEGMRTPPRFTDYLERCLAYPPRRSVYGELDDDGE